MQAGPARSCWRDPPTLPLLPQGYARLKMASGAGVCGSNQVCRGGACMQCGAVPTTSPHIVQQQLLLHRPRATSMRVCPACSPALPPTAVRVLPLALRLPAGPILLSPGPAQVEGHLQIRAHSSPPAHRPPPRCLSSALGAAKQDEETGDMIPSQF
jgi:hypothetical protein